MQDPPFYPEAMRDHAPFNSISWILEARKLLDDLYAWDEDAFNSISWILIGTGSMGLSLAMPSMTFNSISWIQEEKQNYEKVLEHAEEAFFQFHFMDSFSGLLGLLSGCC